MKLKRDEWDTLKERMNQITVLPTSEYNILSRIFKSES